MDSLEFEDLEGIVELLCTLKCPVCFGEVEKDAVICVNGHCYCTKCRTYSENNVCPTCREGVSNIEQNSLVRQILDIIPRTCYYNNCSYLVKPGDDHESYCRYKPTPCKLCEQKVPAVELANHLNENHPELIVFPCGSVSNLHGPDFMFSNISIHSLLSIHDHFIWQHTFSDRTSAVLTLAYTPVFCGKPTHDLSVKVCFKSEEEEYEVRAKIKMKSTTAVSGAETTSLTIPISVVEKFYDKDAKSFYYEETIKKIQEYTVSCMKTV